MAQTLTPTVNQVLLGAQLSEAGEKDLAELLVLQRCAWVGEALLLESVDIPALRENLCELKASVSSCDTLVVRHEGRLVGSVRARLDEHTWDIRRLMVVPDLTGKGLGSALMAAIEERAPRQVGQFRLFTASRNEANVRFFEGLGYRIRDTLPPPRPTAAEVVNMTKNRGQ